jgi:hypothetical protein
MGSSYDAQSLISFAQTVKGIGTIHHINPRSGKHLDAALLI